MIASKKIVVLDRDGTIIVDRGYLARPEGVELLPGAAQGLRLLHEHGYLLIVITNQSGVGRGLFTMGDVDAVNTRLQTMVREAGAELTKVYACPHKPEDGCLCRKPRTGLMQLAAREQGFDPVNCFVVGDKGSDIEFGARSGSKSIWINSERALTIHADATVSNLLEAAQFITRSRPLDI